MSLNLSKLKADLIRDECIAKRREDRPGRLFIYRDSVGIDSIGVGRNMRDKGISVPEAMFMLDNDIQEHLDLLDRELPWWRELDDVRQLALANLAFNLGVGPTVEQPEGKLLTFKSTLALLHAGDYEKVAEHLKDTPWYKQVGDRGKRIVSMLETGIAV